jgi:Leucine-rich repeat (LRR) protein
LRISSRGFSFHSIVQAYIAVRLLHHYNRIVIVRVSILVCLGISLATFVSAVSAQQADRKQSQQGTKVSDTSAASSDSLNSRNRRLRTPRPARPGIFTSLDSAKTMPDSVIVLNLRGKSLGSIQGLTAFKNLKVLDLSGNGLKAFPPEILALTQINAVDLSDNPIGSVPNEIGNLASLSRLSLRNTGITTLPPTIGRCKGLSALDVSRNPLATLPIKELNLLPSLRSVTIAGYKEGQPTDTTTDPKQPAKQK